MKFCRRRFSASSVLDLLKKLLDRRPADLQPRTLRYHGNPHPEMIVRRRKEQLFPRGSSYQWLKGHTESMAAWMLWSKTARRQDYSRVEGLGALEPGQKPTPTWLQGIRSRTGSAEQTDDGGRTRTETQTPNVSFLPETQPRSRETDPTQAPPQKKCFKPAWDEAAAGTRRFQPQPKLFFILLFAPFLLWQWRKAKDSRSSPAPPTLMTKSWKLTLFSKTAAFLWVLSPLQLFYTFRRICKSKPLDFAFVNPALIPNMVIS